MSVSDKGKALSKRGQMEEGKPDVPTGSERSQGQRTTKSVPVPDGAPDAASIRGPGVPSAPGFGQGLNPGQGLPPAAKEPGVGFGARKNPGSVHSAQGSRTGSPSSASGHSQKSQDSKHQHHGSAAAVDKAPPQMPRPGYPPPSPLAQFV